MVVGPERLHHSLDALAFACPSLSAPPSGTDVNWDRSVCLVVSPGQRTEPSTSRSVKVFERAMEDQVGADLY
jgi:hypothetical protein